MILNNIAEMVGTELKIDLHQKNRKQPVIYARAIYYRLAREYTPYSLQRIADVFNKNHATALHGYKLFENFKMQPKLYAQELQAYKNIASVLEKVKVEKKETHVERLIREKELAEQQRDEALEKASKVEYRLYRLVSFLNGYYKTDKYNKYAEV